MAVFYKYEYTNKTKNIHPCQTTRFRDLQNTVYKYTHTQPLMVCFRELQNEIKALRHRLDNQRIDTGLS